MPSLNSNEIASVLIILKELREQLCLGFIENSPEIYLPSYKYENSPKLLAVAREKYFMIWIGSFWNKLQDHLNKNCCPETHEKVKDIFADVFMKFLSKWGVSKELNHRQLHLGLAMIDDLNTALDAFIKAAENSEALKNNLVLSMEKSRALFDRKLKELEEELLL